MKIRITTVDTVTHEASTDVVDVFVKDGYFMNWETGQKVADAIACHDEAETRLAQWIPSFYTGRVVCVFLQQNGDEVIMAVGFAEVVK